MPDKEKFLKNVKEATGKPNATIKPKLLQIDGMTTTNSITNCWTHYGPSEIKK